MAKAGRISCRLRREDAKVRASDEGRAVMPADLPTLHHDPTSGPSRAGRGFSLDAGMALRVEPVPLTRGEHGRPAPAAIDPRHRRPALLMPFCPGVPPSSPARAGGRAQPGADEGALR
ncbi:hypothetical protein [Solimonas variicoloris]|uniref:hypothetical protein n=1 Tax=Solimonas variicoloris TaxID=254408 RepID=UPI00037F669A|nr:hypothetical protein [Solimonas variicoloris]